MPSKKYYLKNVRDVAIIYNNLSFSSSAIDNLQKEIAEYIKSNEKAIWEYSKKIQSKKREKENTLWIQLSQSTRFISLINQELNDAVLQIAQGYIHLVTQQSQYYLNYHPLTKIITLKILYPLIDKHRQVMGTAVCMLQVDENKTLKVNEFRLWLNKPETFRQRDIQNTVKATVKPFAQPPEKTLAYWQWPILGFSMIGLIAGIILSATGIASLPGTALILFSAHMGLYYAGFDLFITGMVKLIRTVTQPPEVIHVTLPKRTTSSQHKIGERAAQKSVLDEEVNDMQQRLKRSARQIKCHEIYDKKAKQHDTTHTVVTTSLSPIL